MVKSSMEDILELIDWSLDDKSDAKDRFHEYLLKDKWQPEHFEGWIQECIRKGDASHKVWYNALQDIVVSIGDRLGFDVEFGHYSGGKEKIAFDGAWSRSSGEVILIEVKASGWPVTSVGQLGEYVKRYVESTAADASNVFGLYVIGDSDVQHLVGHLACRLPFLYNGFASSNWSAGAGTGGTQSVPSLAGTHPTCCSFATPLERRGITIPAACCSLQPIDDLKWRGRMLAIQGTAFQDALDRFGHIQPGTA